MSAPDPKKRDTLVSKALSYLLRHGAQKEKLPIDLLGWVPVDAILSNNRLKTHKATFADLQRIVENNEKQRFRLKQDGKIWLICANQGHTLKTIVPELMRLEKSTMPSEVYHGTYKQKLASILETGLSRMARNHIHLTSNAPWSKLGIRTSCNTLLYIDTDLCMDDGFEFWRSANGVILCEGNSDGVIPPKYFKKIEAAGDQEV
ncbi:phosphotransferase KptA/Tpt1 [Metschnikowia bicuspidata var. bicuspidata NRRL YB-4993]|uniref:2'-phosphotransferase n=1 Tax=Metschnikowia bicuspidata var. bicuspidata NRRL YB-4993 TaxID=869754 RepID=A0A1A0HE39_9ASCO|nr:phosphotransferase KptA/Tpt1 [Metschnikowia bicuspidata var. bicuspidata NRRL YB-4993]OBA22369.1 phosphotransferase KptA/Tpt1 [Metschnikowia bicuspidata var. bicuspidata NRRL YB-4993]